MSHLSLLPLSGVSHPYLSPLHGHFVSYLPHTHTILCSPDCLQGDDSVCQLGDPFHSLAAPTVPCHSLLRRSSRGILVQPCPLQRPSLLHSPMCPVLLSAPAFVLTVPSTSSPRPPSFQSQNPPNSFMSPQQEGFPDHTRVGGFTTLMSPPCTSVAKVPWVVLTV